MEKNPKPATKPLRLKMPQVSAFLDDLREAFGAKLVDDRIRRGVRGEATFHASENGHQVGTPMRAAGSTIWYDPSVGAKEGLL